MVTIKNNIDKVTKGILLRHELFYFEVKHIKRRLLD